MAITTTPILPTTKLINVGAAANDGTGDQLRTAFEKANTLFNEGVVVHQGAPATLAGAAGDLQGVVTTDGTDVWVCHTTYANAAVPGTTPIWVKLPNAAEVTAAGAAEVNDLSAAVVWANVPDGNITETSVVQHKNASAVKDITTAGSSRDFAANDGNTLISTTGATTLTIRLEGSVAIPIGTEIHVANTGAGIVTMAAEGGVTLTSIGSLVNVTINGRVKLIKIASDSWLLSGDIA